MELIKKLIDLFNDLRRINFNSEEKPSDAENLTDILEIVAVAYRYGRYYEWFIYSMMNVSEI